MTRNINKASVRPVTAAGVLATASGAGYALLAGTTYYYELSGNNTTDYAPWVDPNSDRNPPIQSAHLLFDAAIVITSVEIEDTNFEDVLTNSTTAGEWIKEDPTTAYVAKIGAGMSVVNATLAKTAGAIGAAMVHIGNGGARRTRLKVVVGVTGGVARVGATEKG